MIEPRYRWVPPRDKSLGRECADWWRSGGGQLDEWQEAVIDGFLGVAGEKWASLEDGLDVARQNGKGVVLQAIEGYCAFELHYPVVMHTSHEFATSTEHQLRLESFIQDASHLHARVKDKGGYVHANGQESIRLKDGSRIIFKARTKGGGRGYSGDLLVWDEAMVIPEAVVGAQMPMMRASTARFGPKIIYAGSAVDQEVHEYGVTFARIRERGIAEADGVTWHEWSAPIGSLAEVDEEFLADRRMWAAANPALETRIDPGHMEQEIASMAGRTAAVELLGVGDWPRTDGREDMVISIEQWDALEDHESKLVAPFCVAFDVSPERRTAIAVGGRNEDDKFQGEVHYDRPGTSWVADVLEQISQNPDVEMIVCDAVGPASSLIVELKERGVAVETFNTTEHGQACGRLLDMVTEGDLVHLGSTELRDAVRGAKPRPLGDAWAWSRKNSSVNIAPLVAVTLALGAAAGVTAADMVIY